MRLTYSAVFYPFEEGNGYTVEIPRLPGCVTQGGDIDEAVEMAKDAALGWILTTLEDGEYIPMPKNNLKLSNFKGAKFIKDITVDIDRNPKVININKILKSKRVEIEFTDINVDKDFVKNFRKNNSLTQVELANIIKEPKETIEKWENGADDISGSSAVLLKLLNDNPDLIRQLYKVKK
jgi:predicted RNase H-like HicB family nuclease/DNA-binding transcriptional regulator YiaG